MNQGVNVYDCLGEGYTLLSMGNDAASEDQWREAAEAAAIPLTVIHLDAGTQRDRYEASWALVRPDQFVAWTSNMAHLNHHQMEAVFKRINPL
jgi:hypothetical protein